MATDSYWLPFERAKTGVYDHLSEYIKDRAHSAVVPPDICHALEERVGASVTDRKSWKRFPWVTPVLGSGCLETSGTVLTPAGLQRAVEERLDQLVPEGGWTDAGEHPATIGGRFAHSLAETRLKPAMEGQPTHGRSSGDVEIDDLAVTLVVVAARITAIFHLVSEATASALGRWYDEVAIAEREMLSSPSLRTLEPLHLEPLQGEFGRALELLADEDHDLEMGNLAVGTASLLEKVRRDLNGVPLKVRGIHARLLGEVAWCFLLRTTPVYPGWTTSLLRLMLGPRGGYEKLDRLQRPRPSFGDLRDVGTAVKTLFSRPTEASWERTVNRDPPPRSDLYDRCAELLWAQRDALLKAAPAYALPPAVAFVTSFDLELEMALLRTARGREDRGQFSVLVPVYVETADMARGEFCWLRSDIDVPPGTEASLEDLDAVRAPGADQWRLARDAPRARRADEHSRPVVVHLSGAPLIDLPRSIPPRLVGELDKMVNIKGATTLHHAITVDEYVAVRQSQLEDAWHALTGSGSEDMGRKHLERLIPEELRRSSSFARRFWMALGVPVSDPAIRSRVISQLAIRPQRGEAPPIDHSDEMGIPIPVRDDDPETEGTPEVAQGIVGLAVNWQLDAEEALLLNSLGLDVLRTHLRHMVAPLTHITDHLADVDPVRGRPDRYDVCNI